MSFSTSRKMIIAMCIVTFISGCAMLGGDDEKSGEAVSSVPRKRDSITMRNYDVITGSLGFDSIELKTAYLPTLKLKTDDIDTIEFVGKAGKAKVRTKAGDVLRGSLSIKKFKLLDTSLPQDPVFEQKDIKLIHCR